MLNDICTYLEQKEVLSKKLGILKKIKDKLGKNKPAQYCEEKSGSDISVYNNFDGEIDYPTWQQVREYLDKMIEIEEEFIVLCRKKAANNVTFIQAATIPEGYTFQIGIEVEGKNEILEKTCEIDEIIQAFSCYYNDGIVEVDADFSPLEMMR